MFEVGIEKAMTADYNRVNTSSSNYPAHSLILEDCAPYLFNLCTSGADSTSIPITDVKLEMFHHIMLYYVYGGKVPEEDLKSNAKDIIDAADK